MTSSEISRSELVRAMVEVGTLLTGPKPLEERMHGMCAASTYVLGCDCLIVMLRDNDRYRGAFQFGLPEALAPHFAKYEVERDKPLIKQLEQCDTYLLFNGANKNPAVSRIAELANVASLIIVPFTHPDGTALGYIAAAYTTDKRTVTTDEAELAMGMARIVQTTLLRNLETQRRREVSQAMLQVADSERRRLSRDIHDDPLQRILGLRVGLEGFRAQIEDAELQTEVDRFIEQCRSASGSLREVMLRTHPHASEMADLEMVLDKMVERREFDSSTKLTFADERSGESPSYLVPAINRIAEQAARNTLRHAKASQLKVTLADDDGGTLLTIEDDGSGFDPNTVDQSRLGIVSMRERTELFGGRFLIESSIGTGTHVSVWFPHGEVITE